MLSIGRADHRERRERALIAMQSTEAGTRAKEKNSNGSESGNNERTLLLPGDSGLDAIKGERVSSKLAATPGQQRPGVVRPLSNREAKDS